MNDTLLVALVAAVPAIILSITGAYQAVTARRSRQEDTRKVRAEADEIFQRIRLMQMEREEELLARLVALEKDKDYCGKRLVALEIELRLTKQQHADELRLHQEQVSQSLQTRELMEGDFEKLRLTVKELQEENAHLRRQLQQLVNRVETGPIGS